MRKQPDPWSVAEALSETPATLYEWRWRLGPFFDPFRSFLRPSPSPDELYVPCVACNQQVPALRDISADGYFATHPSDSPCTHAAAISTHDASVWAFDITALARALRAHLPVLPPTLEDAASSPRMIGTLAGQIPMPVFILFGADTLRCHAQALPLLTAHRPPLIFLTAKPRARLAQLLSAAGAHVLSLSQFLSWSPEGLVPTGVDFGQTVLATQSPNAAIHTLAPAVARIEAKFDTLAHEHSMLRVENEQLKKTAAAAFAHIARKVHPDDLRIFGAVLAGGTLAAAARTLKTSDSTLRSKVDPWASRGPEYRLMLDLIGWRKKVDRKITTPFDERWTTGEVAGDTVLPDIITEIVSALREQNASNWQAIRDELLQLLHDERGS